MTHLTLKIEDIPDNLRLILKKDVQSFLVSQAVSKYRSPKDLARVLGVDYTTLHKWRKEGSSMKLKYLKGILSVLKINLSKISRSVLGVKGESSVKVIFKKRLPFEIPVDLIAHLQGDGSVSKRDCRCSYKNLEPFLIDSLIRSVLNVFDTKIYTNVSEGANIVELPCTIGKILVSKFGSFRSKEFSVPRLHSIKAIRKYTRAIFDDEGWVVNTKDQKNVSIELYNKQALEQIQKFLNYFEIKSHIYDTELRITGHLNVKLFAKRIGFSHPLQKIKIRELLKSYKANRKDKISITKRKIIKLTKKVPMSTQQLIQHLNLSRWTIQRHVYELIRTGKIYRIRDGKKVLFYVVK